MIHSPSLFLRVPIRFLLFLVNLEAWYNFVFLSPDLEHIPPGIFGTKEALLVGAQGQDLVGAVFQV